MREFTWPVRVYYEDTDAAGLVYHGNFIRYLERARTEWLRGLGVDQGTLRADHGVLFVVRELRIRYESPARMDEKLEVRSRIAEAGGARILFEQSIYNVPGDCICRARVEVVCLDSTSLKPRRLPKFIESELTDVD
jgi:acyl-CoA thioester hydrolase